MNEELVAALVEAEVPFRTLVDDSDWTHASIEGLVLDLGRRWSASPDTWFVEHGAFSVAMSEAARIPNGVYVEGYVWVGGQMRPAAWCGAGEKVVYGPQADAPLGVPLSPRFCRRVQKRNGTAAVLMSKDSRLLPLLTNGLPPDAVLLGSHPGPRLTITDS